LVALFLQQLKKKVKTLVKPQLSKKKIKWYAIIFQNVLENYEIIFFLTTKIFANVYKKFIL
jgi:hypothetical protein